MGHEPVLIPDYTLFIQLGIFMASYLVLRTLVFGPFVELLEAREAKTTGLKEKAVEAEQQATKFKSDYEALMTEEKKKLAQYVDGEKRKIETEVREILDEARHTASQQMEAVKDKVAQESEAARGELRSKVSEFASQMTSQILGYSVTIQGASTSKARAGGQTEEAVPG